MIKFIDEVPNHAVVVEIFLKDGTKYEVCTFFHAFEYLKNSLNKSAIEEYGKDYMESQLQLKIEDGSIPKYFAFYWVGNNSTEIDISCIESWKYLHN
jgi:hypothetical protein